MQKFSSLLKLLACATVVSLSVASAQSQMRSGMFSLPSLPGDNLLRTTPADASLPNPVIQQSERPLNRTTLWKFSIAALASANAVDIASSWGKRELNPALSMPAAKFGTQSAGLKSAIVGVVIGIEYLATRHHPSPTLMKTLSILNFCDAGVISGVAARNFTVPAYTH